MIHCTHYYTYLFRHGFGFTNEYWRNLSPLIPGNIAFFDENFVPQKDAHYVGVGHSIGFQKLNNSNIDFDFLIGLQGFINFCGTDPDERKARAMNLDRMTELFRTDAVKAMNMFYAACEYRNPHANSDSDLGVDLQGDALDALIADLLSMKESYNYRHECPTLIIGSSSRDDIVPMSVINDNFENIPNVKIKTIENVPHSLGFLKAKEVAEMIAKFIDER